MRKRLAQKIISEVAQLKQFIQTGEEKERLLIGELNNALSSIPNLPFGDVPVGKDENDNIELRKIGHKPRFDFEPKEHFEIGEGLAVAGSIPEPMDFQSCLPNSR